MKAWHFVGEKLRDGRPVPPDGEWLEHDGELIMCASGLHACRRIIDALWYAPGNIICRVELGGKIIVDGEKLVATRRKILWRVDGDEPLREFIRWCSRKSTRNTTAMAWDAAWDAAWDKARIAERAMKTHNAWEEAWIAAWDAANEKLEELVHDAHAKASRI